MIRSLTAVAATLLLVSACSSLADETGATTAEPAPAETPSTEPTAAAATPSSNSTSPAASDLPPRAEQESYIRVLAEGTFIKLLRDAEVLPGTSDEDLIAAGHAGCDAFDRGDSLQSAAIIVAALLPEATTAEEVGTVLGDASGTLCPEYAAG
ncbi:MAG: DUF732 domain-containing protein [Georgenia sp.]